MLRRQPRLLPLMVFEQALANLAGGLHLVAQPWLIYAQHHGMEPTAIVPPRLLQGARYEQLQSLHCQRSASTPTSSMPLLVPAQGSPRQHLAQTSGLRHPYDISDALSFDDQFTVDYHADLEILRLHRHAVRDALS
eukprot:6479536-Amphidinium_carterae.1